MASSRTIRAACALTLGLVLAASAGCVRVELPKQGYTTETDVVVADGATKAVATIDMGAGTLSISGGAEALMEGRYVFSWPASKPEVEYAVDSGEGRLSVRQVPSETKTLTSDFRNEWDLTFTDDLPLELTVNMGAGRADLDLRGTALRRLDVNLGAGDTTVDLSGSWDASMTADVNAGAGKLTVRVPSGVGVRIVGYQDGLGSYRADGFTQDGAALVNDAYETADVRFDIVLRRGIGDVTVETVN